MPPLLDNPAALQETPIRPDEGEPPRRSPAHRRPPYPGKTAGGRRRISVRSRSSRSTAPRRWRGGC